MLIKINSIPIKTNKRNKKSQVKLIPVKAIKVSSKSFQLFEIPKNRNETQNIKNDETTIITIERLRFFNNYQIRRYHKSEMFN